MGGYAYLVLGATPAGVSGVTPVDPAVLDQAVRRYVGSEARWHPEYVEVEQQQVLVVAVEPPQLGDPVVPVQKAMGPIQAGTVLIRRPGKTEQADPAELRMLIDREKAAYARLELNVLVLNQPLERIMDPTAAVEDWLVAERRALLAAGKVKQSNTKTEAAPGSAATSQLVSAFDQTTRLTAAVEKQFGVVSALFGSASSSWANIGSEPDPRTVEDYQRGVDAYLADCRKVLLQRFTWRTLRRPEHHLALELVNNTDKNFHDVQVVVNLAGEVRIFDDDNLELLDIDEPAVPRRPQPLGTRRSKGSFGGATFGAVPDSVLRGSLYPARLRSIPVEPQPPAYRARNTGSVTIEYGPLDLRPRKRMKLKPVPLVIPSEGEDIDVIEGTWSATARNVDGEETDGWRIEVVGSTLDIHGVLSGD